MPPNTTIQTDQFTQLLTSVEEANNVLVTVSADPSVDQLAAAIGLTLALNKKGKHATAVFSGKVPSTLEFLQPDRTIEKNTDSLQDFIISLDKSKADKLRYKVEDDFVKIFITPYRSSVSEVDLNFSQGDFNVDLIITIGVQEKAHLDEAIIAHGRILHDATVATITTVTLSAFGSINWLDNESSSLCEMITDLVNGFGKEVIDAQIATALLTGMVAETDRFGNEKVRPHTMSLSGILMAAGASTQLIVSKLEEPIPEPEIEEPESEAPSEEIPEVIDEEPSEESIPEPTYEPEPIPEPEIEEPESEAPKPNNDGVIKIEHEDDIHIDGNGRLLGVKQMEDAQNALQEEQDEAAKRAAENLARTQAEADAQIQAEQQAQQEQSETEQPTVAGRGLVLDPPTLSGQLTANSVPEDLRDDQVTDSLSGESSAPLIGRFNRPTPADSLASEGPVDQTISDLERAVNSPHVDQEAEVPPLDDARAEVDEAMISSDYYRPEPINALNATPFEVTAPSESVQPEGSSTTPPPPVPPPMPPSTYGV